MEDAPRGRSKAATAVAWDAECLLLFGGLLAEPSGGGYK